MPLDSEQAEEVRKIARQEIASLAGLVLRRSQEADYTRSPDRNAAIDEVNSKFASIFGEALADFSETDGVEPGE